MPLSSDNKCLRKGCRRTRQGKSANRQCCSAYCFYVWRWYEESHAILEHLNHSDPVDEYVLATGELCKSLERVMNARSTLRRLSLEAGWTNDQWDRLVRGAWAEDAGTGQSETLA